MCPGSMIWRLVATFGEARTGVVGHRDIEDRLAANGVYVNAVVQLPGDVVGPGADATVGGDGQRSR